MGPEAEVAGVLPEGLLEAVRERLAGGHRLRRTLPRGGRLHIDRPLPFLVVCRRPVKRRDPGTRRLALSQASYLALSADDALVEPLRDLVGTVVETLSARFGAFLLVELWTAAAEGDRPRLVRVVTPDQQAALAATDELAAALGEMEIGYWRPEVRQAKAKVAAPPGLPPLLDASTANRLSCFSVGLELDPMFRDAAGTLYPELLRELTGQLSTALQRAFFAFSRAQTSGDAPASHEGLGRRAMVRAVRYVDEDLGELCAKFDFLLAVTPVDTTEAWSKFRDSGFREEPSFRYRPLTTDPELMLRELYAVPLENVEDPTLDRIFREKLREVARQLTMFAERNTHRFLQGSLQLYGGVEPELLRLAEGLLATLGGGGGENGGGDGGVGAKDGAKVDAEAFAGLALEEFSRYRERDADFDATLDVRDDISGLMVSKGTLLIPRTLSLDEHRARALIHHEIGTHIVTWMNGRKQSLQVFRTGLAGYEELQEGLAVLAEYLAGGLTRGRLKLLAARVIAVERMIRGAGFVAIFRELTGSYGLSPRSAFTATMRVTRGGGLTKDAAYLRGLQHVVGYIRDGGDLEHLYVGKVALRHVPIVRELRYRGVLEAPAVLPAVLDAPGAGARLAALREGKPLVEIFEKDT